MIDDVRGFLRQRGLDLDPRITELRDTQQQAIEWAQEATEPYLFINAPTGSGKTLMLGVQGCLLGKSWTYGVHTIRLQEQTAEAFPGLPVMKGRRNFGCPIGRETHGVGNVTADESICAAGQWCEYTGRPPRDAEDYDRWEDHDGKLCDYYAMRKEALDSDYRTANYAFLLADHQSLVASGRTDILLADEAHNIENVVCHHSEQFLFAPSYGRLKLQLPGGSDLPVWAEWARRGLTQLPPTVKSRQRPDFGLQTVRRQLTEIAAFSEKDTGQWLVLHEENGVRFQPIWGAPLVMEKLLGHTKAPDPLDTSVQGVRRVIFTSATLMGADFIADMLGLPEGSWAYLDLASTFPVEHRPINYWPVTRMNYKTMATLEGRAPMQAAIDRLIEYYITNGAPTGIIHAVSNKYRDNILTESAFRGILTNDPVEHSRRVARGEASIVVAANLAEGWDGVDSLCRFVLMPKVPYPFLGDQRTRVRKEEDPRTFEHAGLVGVVQGAGRGVRHASDYADTWILDPAWGYLMQKRKEWLPESFMDAYYGNVRLPE